jgi:rare lipoprotein A
LSVNSGPPRKPYQVGLASYYGRRFHGRRTANGERFNMYNLTAAHRAVPLGTLLRVTNLENGKCVTVRVNDRGPYVRGRILDLSFAAARELQMLHHGTTKVKIEILDAADRHASRQLYEADDSAGSCAY